MTEEQTSMRNHGVCADIIKEIDEKILLLFNFTISQLSKHFPNISRAVLYEALTVAEHHWETGTRSIPVVEWPL
ncbi:hypothetical protein TNCV_1431871 [Trichonephila clavipes]|nr:hypothetical protein TNCV_1431871 [Trichonephila clavipes]